MCGIVGIVNTQQVPVSPEILDSMRDRLVHRGPDSCGSWISSSRQVGLAHRRLAILDLSPGGHQPMLLQSGGLAISFNGEIYNYKSLKQELEQLGHRFSSNSDTEVLLGAYQQWGQSCFERLVGMFALAIWDENRQELILARDRAGEKPLYYWLNSTGLKFSSELKSILLLPEAPRRLQPSAFSFFLAYGYVPNTQCILQEVAKLPAAHYAVYRPGDGTLSTKPYWSLPSRQSLELDKHPEELLQEFHQLLQDAVRLQLQADVPVGVLLSGGVDSSLITAVAAAVSGRQVKTFTVTFPGFAKFNEAPFAKQVADHFGTEHHELIGHEPSAELLTQLATQYDEPFADSSQIPTYLVSKLIREHATVALGGDGGDELFGGYPHHAWAQLRPYLTRLPSIVRGPVRWAIEKLPIGTRGRNYAKAMFGDPRQRIADFNTFFDHAQRGQLLNDRSLVGAPELLKIALQDPSFSLLQNSTRTDFSTYLPGDILVKVDRASMLASLEVRAPFLDHRLIEFAFSQVPDALRASPARTKILPKMLASRLLPASLPLERKQGFSIPIDSWMRGPWRGTVESVLLDPSNTAFNRSYLERLLKLQKDGLGLGNHLFMLFMFEQWRQSYKIEVG